MSPEFNASPQTNSILPLLVLGNAIYTSGQLVAMATGSESAPTPSSGANEALTGWWDSVREWAEDILEEARALGGEEGGKLLEVEVAAKRQETAEMMSQFEAQLAAAQQDYAIAQTGEPGIVARALAHRITAPVVGDLATVPMAVATAMSLKASPLALRPLKRMRGWQKAVLVLAAGKLGAMM